MRTTRFKPIITSLLFITNSVLATPIAIIAPMPSESVYLKTQIQDLKKHREDHMTYYTGTIAHHRVLLLNSGIGKVDNSSAATWLHCKKHSKLIILTGSSGASNPKLKIGDVIVGKRVFDADYGHLTTQGPKFLGQIKNPNTGQTTPTYFDSTTGFYNQLKGAMTKAHKAAPKYTFSFGTIVTSDALPNPAWQRKLFRANHVDVVAMEDAAVDKVCWLFHMKCINIRGVSNVAGVKQSDEATATAAHNAAMVAVNLITKLPK